MMTEEDFYAIAKARPDIIRMFCNAVNAVINLRRGAAAGPSSPWAGVRLKEKHDAATLLMTQFADCFIVNGHPLSEDEKKRVQSWVLRAANFHLSLNEEVRAPDADQAALPDIEAVA